MMTLPGIEALKKKYPSKKIYYALPKQYHSVVENNPHIDKVLDVKIPLQNNKFSVVMDISSPCAQYESNKVRTGKKVDLGRIEIFAEALGTRNLLEEIKPSYYPDKKDIEWAKNFLPKRKKPRLAVIPRAAEEYRNWPLKKMEQLVSILKDDFECIIIDPIREFLWPGIIDACGFPFPKAAAILLECDMVLTPDTAMLHLAASKNIPTLALFGPIDGHTRCKDYPNTTVLISNFNCIPCWRNSNIPCKISNTVAGESECMKAISIEAVHKALMKIKGNL